MWRSAQHSRINQLVAIGAGLALGGMGLFGASPATAATSTKHASAAHHAKKSTHKSSAKKTVTRSASVAHKTAVKHPVSTPAAAAAAAPAACANGGVTPTADDIAVVRAATLCLINQQRADAGLAPLVENAALDAAAQAHSGDMVATDYFNHVAPSGTDMLARIVSAGFATVADVLDVGENLAASVGPLATPAATVATWMASAEHRANILDPTFKQTGIGVVAALPAVLGLGGSGATYTQNFGTAS